jgi:hypothetical protein
MATKHAASRWFDVDPDGLRLILARRGYGFVVHELVQNAWDAPDCKHVMIYVQEAQGMLELMIADDALAGVEDLRDLYTLFAPSKKKSDPTKRGRFNIGEKLAISTANSARVTSTGGTVYFRPSGTREYNGARKSDTGTIVTLRFLANAKLNEELCNAARNLIPPAGIVTELITPKGQWELEQPKQIGSIPSVQLPTEIDKGDGLLHPTVRRCGVSVWEYVRNTGAMLYELGIPVCTTDFPWDVEVLQKVPLTLDRESVSPAFLRKLGVHLLNGMYEQLTTVESVTAPWVRLAASSPDCSELATKHVNRVRFGEKAVAYDPSDPEASMRAMAEGYTVVHGGSMSAGEWQNVKRVGTILPAGQVTGTPQAIVGSGEGARELKELFEYQLSSEEMALKDYMGWLAAQLIGPITLRFYRDKGWNVIAACGPDHVMIVNLARFQWEQQDELHRVLIHELAHIREANHLGDDYHHELGRLGARLARITVQHHDRIAQWVWPLGLKTAALRED